MEESWTKAGAAAAVAHVAGVITCSVMFGLALAGSVEEVTHVNEDKLVSFWTSSTMDQGASINAQPFEMFFLGFPGSVECGLLHCRAVIDVLVFFMTRSLTTGVALRPHLQWMVVVTCACGSPETGIRFMNPKGDCLATLDTNQVTFAFALNYY